MATYNGEQYIREQLESILRQLNECDEVVIVDDGSIDKTVDIVESLQDSRVRLYKQSNQGVVKAFERAIVLASKPALILSDQDDLWPSKRVVPLVGGLDRAPLSAGALSTIGHDAGQWLGFQTQFPTRTSALLAFAVGKAPYYGSCMCFNSRVRSLSLPFPTWIEAHDHWLAICGIALGRPWHVREVVTLRRLHETNLSPRTHRGVRALMRTRAIMLGMVVLANYRRVSRARAQRRSTRMRSRTP